MYLSDKDIRDLLGAIRFETPPNTPAFDEAQIQPASIDLRIGDVFWHPRVPPISRGRRMFGRKPFALDLLKTRWLEMRPRAFWEKRVLGETDSFLLGPGELVLARTHEKFSIPHGYAGKIEGRSSYARLGLTIHCTGDFMNPGYRGHMPLQLFNHNPFPIRVYAFVPACQLILIQLSSDSTQKYDADDVTSKYLDDDGGPSYWWRDNWIRELQRRLRTNRLDERVQDDLLERAGHMSPEVMQRLSEFLDVAHHSDQENVDAILQSFAKSEDRMRKKQRLTLQGSTILVTLLVGAAGVVSTLDSVTTLGKIAAWIVTLIVGLWALHENTKDRPREFLGQRELDSLSASALGPRSITDRDGG